MKYGIGLLLILFGIQVVNAQVNSDDSVSVENSRIEGIEIFEKPEPLIPVPQQIFTKPEFKYKEVTFKIPIELPSSSIRLPMPLTTPLPLYPRGYVKLGLGRFGGSVGDIALHHAPNQKTAWFIQHRHRAHSVGFIDKAQDLNESFQTGGSLALPQHEFRYHILGDYQQFYHYGIPPATQNVLHAAPRPEITTDGKGSFGRAEAQIGLHRVDSSHSSGYSGDIRYRYFKEKTGASENHISLLPTGNFRLGDYTFIRGKGEFTFSSISDYQRTASRTFLDLTPDFVFQKENFYLSGGVRLNYYQDTTPSYVLLPMIKVRFEIIPDRLRLHLGNGGGMQWDTRWTRFMENRYLFNTLNLLPTQEKWKVYMEIEGNLPKGWYGTLRMERKNYKRLPVYVETPGLPGYFSLAYDEGANVTQLSGALTWKQQTQWQSGISAQYNWYSMAQLAANFHQPVFRMEAFLTWAPTAKFSLTLRTFTFGSRPLAQKTESSGTTTIIKAPAFTDLSLHTEYRFYKSFSLFLEGSNLSGQTWTRWYLYPEMPLDFRAGLGATF
ncbi:MAG: hypothetical protein EBS07_06430 [Sphingobacteriia bacterium]|nr:hypothetical protein [Sphingobacteriia bacterium]